MSKSVGEPSTQARLSRIDIPCAFAVGIKQTAQTEKPGCVCGFLVQTELKDVMWPGKVGKVIFSIHRIDQLCGRKACRGCCACTRVHQCGFNGVSHGSPNPAHVLPAGEQSDTVGLLHLSDGWKRRQRITLC